MSQWRTPSSREWKAAWAVRNTLNEMSKWVLMISGFARPDLLILPQQKKGFPGSLSTTYGPSPSTVSCAAINGTLVHKDKLIWLISSYASCKICLFLNTSLDCSARELFCMLVLPPCDQELILHTFFILYPPFLSVLQIVDMDTDTPCFSWSSNHNSSRFKSGVLPTVLKRCFMTEVNVAKQFNIE